MKQIGLRIDVDTFRGTAKGVPVLCETLKRHNIKGTFYFSVGPDNMGRHLWRLFKPTFLWKMLRTNAAGLYGPEIIFMGTAWPGLKIGKHLSKQIKATAEAGHEIGFHAWDHHKAQAKIDKMSEDELIQELTRGVETLSKITGAPPISSATPGWRTNEMLLKVKSTFPFAFDSDCRGYSLFYPQVNGRKISRLQIPVTLPTYDEICGRNGINDENYNEHQISLLRPDKLNVLTIHAEAEGGRCAELFDQYLCKVKNLGYSVVPLGEIAKTAYHTAPTAKIVQACFPGREGWLAQQAQITS